MVETKKQKQVRVDNWAKFCHQRFQTFFKNSTYCDLTLEFQDNRKLKVHRILMCVCTEYFEEYFDYLKQINQDKKSDVIVMPAALQADVVIPIINFMYTGKLEYKIANFEKLYNASKLMNMSLLTKLLEAQKQTLTPTSEAKKSQSKPGLTPVKKLKLSQSSSTSKSSAQTVSSLSHSTTTKTYPVKTCVNSQLVNKEKVSDSQLPKSTTFSKKATSSNEGHKNLECDAVIDITEDLTSDESSDETKQILIEHKDIIPTTSFDKFQFQKYLNRMPEIDSIKVEPINVELSNQTTPMLIDENDIIMPNTSFDEPQFPSDMNTMPKVNSIKTEPINLESSNKSTPIVIDEIDVMPSTSFDKPEFLNDLNILPKKENLEVEDMIDCIKEEAICIEENEFIKNEVSDMEDDFSDEDCFDDFDRDIRLEATPSTSVQMVRNRKRTRTRALWSPEAMMSAIEAVRSGKKIREVTRAFKVPYSSLRDRLKYNYYDARLGRKPTFSTEEERLIQNHVLILSNQFYGLTALQLRKIAFQFAKANNIKNMFNEATQLAGKDWLYKFLERNPQISLRKPETTSLDRVKGFSKENVATFFQNLEAVMKRYKFNPSSIYNMDETEISTVHKPTRILAPKGQKQVGVVTSGERGETTTVCCAFSASGAFIPPMFIFARKRMTPQLKKNGPPGSIYKCSKSGWITEELFCEWLKHFKKHSKATKDNPVLLIVDNDTSHISLDCYNFCREKGIVLLSIPPHTSHRLQPLDICFYGPLKKAYDRECDLYVKTHPLEKITIYDVAELFNKAYGRVASIQKAIKGFTSTGIYPLNPAIFNDDFPDFIEQQPSTSGM